MSKATWWISPRFSNSKLEGGQVEDKIDVFEDQISGWFLLHARALCSDQYQHRQSAGFAVLTLVAAYFEAIESYVAGSDSSGKSKEFFRRGFLRVFADFPGTIKDAGYSSPEALANQVIDDIYQQLRCGLFHEALPKNRLLIRKDTAPLSVMLEESTGEVGSIVIDPCRFVAAVEAHFRDYVAALRNPAETQLRANFERFFDTKLSRQRVVLPPPAQVGNP